jgi:hypothetical protein
MRFPKQDLHLQKNDGHLDVWNEGRVCTATPHGARTGRALRLIEIYYTVLGSNSYRAGLKAPSCHVVETSGEMYGMSRFTQDTSSGN